MKQNLDAAVDLICFFEGCVLHAYRDVVGIWSIGFGTTAGVHKGMVITYEQAVELMRQEVDRCAAKIVSLAKVPLQDNELCALVAFAYNVGLGALEKSTLLKKLNSQQSKLDVANEFLKWVHAGGHVLSGLVRRRKAERELFLAAHVVHSGEPEIVAG